MRRGRSPAKCRLALTGDRHTGKYGPDGRLFVSFRCVSPTPKRRHRPFEGDWVGWVGRYDDLLHGDEGQYVVRLKDNTHSYDTTYPGVEVLAGRHVCRDHIWALEPRGATLHSVCALYA